MSKPKPRAHIWLEDGGMVTGCTDPTVARPLIVDAYYDGAVDEEVEHDAEYVASMFPVEQAKVQRGRIVPVGPESAQRDEGYLWLWLTLPDDAKGPGITSAVVWQETR
jgi:hypothetical protein